MSYLALNDRAKYAQHLTDLMTLLAESTDSVYTKGEFIGFFLNRIVKRYLNDPDCTQESFNSIYFNDGKKRKLIATTDSIAALINRTDPITFAGDLDYVLKAVVFGYLEGVCGGTRLDSGNYSYLLGIIDLQCSMVKQVPAATQKDSLIAFRKHLVARGVLCDLMVELSGALHDEDEIPVWGSHNGELTKTPAN